MQSKGRARHWCSKYCQTSCFRGGSLYLVQYSSIISTKVLFSAFSGSSLNTANIFLRCLRGSVIFFLRYLLIIFISDAKYRQSDYCVMYTAL